MSNWPLIAVGGALGTGLRIAVAALTAGAATAPPWPWGTFTANLTGTLLLALVLRATRHTAVLALVATGTLGAYTTFSAFALETVVLVDEGRGAVALTYAGVSIVAGLAAARVAVR